jgi:RimJ/RimL family protein N-acetyltransferase
MNPILLDVPVELQTQRLILRTPRPGEGKIVYPSVRASIEELKTWMPWASDAYNEDAAEEWCRKAAADFIVRNQLQFCIFLRDGRHAGNIGAFRFKWEIPACEIGYWLRTDLVGRGLMTEAAQALNNMLAGTLHMRRIQIVCDNLNRRSYGVAERCGFSLDGTIRASCKSPDNDSLRDERIYSKLYNQDNKS